MYCSCCKADREGRGLKPRELVKLPAYLLEPDEEGPLFKRDDPIYACDYCDGDLVSYYTDL